MYCAHCGKPVDDRAVICPGCGVLINPANLNGVNNTNNTSSSGTSNTLALVGFILSFFVPIAGLICSIMGYKNAPLYNGDKKGFAIAGIVISAVSLAISFIIGIIWGSVLSSWLYYY